MAEKRGNRSSKTAHVLNLLSHPAEASAEEKKEPAVPASQEEASIEAVPQTEAAPAPQEPARLVPPILEVARANHIALEESIHSALEDALSEELPPEDMTAAPEVQPELSPEPEPVIEAEPVAIPEPQPETVAIEEPQPESVPEPEPEVIPALQQDTPLEPVAAQQPEPVPRNLASKVPVDTDVLPDGARFVNLMPEFIDEKLNKYMKMFKLCTCPRCFADAKALALTRLPSKYMVLPSHAFKPMMSFLESKYESDITAQVIYACKDVLANPRHNEDDLNDTK